MAKMNNISFSQIIELLDIPTASLLKRLFVSQSLVSRWKSGSRSLSTNSPLYPELLNFILSVNADHGICQLEAYLCQHYREADYADTELLKKALHSYLISGDVKAIKSSMARNEAVFKVYKGLDGRLEALSAFFELALGMKNKKNMYIFDAENYRWSTGVKAAVPSLHRYCFDFMEQGGQIYIFSALYNTKKDTFYEAWQFNSHKNLHPGYYSDYSHEKSAYSHYLIENTMSILFYSPGNHPDDFYTAVYTDAETCDMHCQYLQLKYKNTMPQLPLISANDRSFAFSTVTLHGGSTEPTVLVGQNPLFAFSSKEEMREILQRNKIPKEKSQFCMNWHDYFQEKIKAHPESLCSMLYYQEDLQQAANAPELLDIELSGLTGLAVSVPNRLIRQRLRNMAALLEEPRFFNLYIVPKSYSPIYSVLGEMPPLWCKNQKWYFAFYKKSPLEARLIIDSAACGMRNDLFHDLFFKIPQELSHNAKNKEFLLRLAEQS